MLNLIIIALGVALGIILASIVAFTIMLQPKIINWYTKKVCKLTEKMFEINSEDKTKDL